MSLYNMAFGVKPATFFVLPMLGEGHHPDEFPRFRDCFLGDEEHPEYADNIIVYTRTGGGNRNDYHDENNWIRSLPGFVADYDDSFDSTFACWVFAVPDEWKDDFTRITDGRIGEVSTAYQQRVRGVYPKLADKLDEIWPAATTQGEDSP